MKLQKKMNLFIIIFFAGFFVIPVTVFYLLSEDAALVVAISWALTAAFLQFVLFKCPHCGKLAILAPSGVFIPFVGKKCRYCNKDY